MESDGLFMRPSGPWIRRKHHYLERYCDIFTKAMKGKWHRIYLDVMAGPGRCEIRGSGEIAPGSPFVALERDFDEYRFYEADPGLAAVLQQRVDAHPKADRCRVIQGSWIDAVMSPTFALPQDSLTLAFVDPTGISQVPWQAVRALALSSQRIDVMFTIQHALGIKWNAHQYLRSEDETAADAFVGTRDWRTRMIPPTTPCQALIDTFVEKMGGLGFGTRDWQLVDMGSGVTLYYLCLFSRSTLALKFWKEVGLKNEDGQRVMRWDD